MRDFHWKTLERIAEHDPLEICWWDKYRRHKREKPDNLLALSPMRVDLARWLRDHADWIEEGSWSDETCSMPYRITDAGREALANRGRHDSEPVYGGMIEPGWQAEPLPEDKETII